jgi:hypothetical protein
MSHTIAHSSALDFITAGKAIFTCKSLKTGTRFTYKVAAPKDQSKEASTILFVQVLTGSDNTSDYSFFGCLRRNGDTWSFATSPKSRIGATAPSVVAFDYIFRNLASGRTIDQLEIWHEGKCCRCGRKLTDPVSIETGIGPECASRKAA